MAPIAPIGLIQLKGSVEFTEKVNYYLTTRRSEYQQEAFVSKYPGFYRQDYRIEVENARFSSGEGKAVIKNTVRGHDLYIISDVMNPSITYKMYGQLNHMSPDDHYQDLKRVILACSGKARRINVIMPFLYESRQHKRNARESLDCAFALEELYNLGVANIITFDAHDERVANAIPLSGFESLPSNYQMIKEMYRQIPDLSFTKGKFMVVSPDEGGIGRAMYYASILGVPLGTFYKRRDYTTVVNGRNPIIAHEFLGDSVEGMDILIVDDMISSGDSMLDIAKAMKERGARKVFCAATFGLFTEGIENFNKAYEAGIFDKVFATNLIYRRPELLEAPWFADVNMCKFVALLIDAINHDASLSNLINPTEKIKKLLKEKGENI
ncbi:MAG: ribose-phosphate pyrophosphokinase [Saccharofermentans sp.]|nr:ribose-phosphate pyrophosphokinase [Clostridiales bacterium]MCR5049131.1 ribose-phosphate pyrophosphokinase [Saccharofermentans sp.]MCR5200909.1 ribose-phosphate pyrophosphokinase [Saccharofermentans sp.]